MSREQKTSLFSIILAWSANLWLAELNVTIISIIGIIILFFLYKIVGIFKATYISLYLFLFFLQIKVLVIFLLDLSYDSIFTFFSIFQKFHFSILF